MHASSPPACTLIKGTFEESWKDIFKSFNSFVLISSVPLYALRANDRDGYLTSINNAIASGKVRRCVQYSYLPILPWPKARNAFMGNRSFVLRNLPPAWIWRKDTLRCGQTSQNAHPQLELTGEANIH